MELYSVERNGVKVGEFVAKRDTVRQRVIEVVLRQKPCASDMWEVWQEPRAARVVENPTLYSYAVVHNADEQGDYYTTYVGDKQISAKIPK